MALVPLEEFDNRIIAGIAQGRLEAEGIATMLFDDGLASLGIGSLTPVRLMVAEEDEDRASAILAGLAHQG